jgi:hypothetical protein
VIARLPLNTLIAKSIYLLIAVNPLRKDSRIVTTKYEFKAGWCPFCHQGWIAFVKQSLSNDMCLLCLECDTAWKSPIDYLTNKPLLEDVFKGKALPVSRDEISEKGWEKFILSSGQDIPFLEL